MRAELSTRSVSSNHGIAAPFESLSNHASPNHLRRHPPLARTTRGVAASVLATFLNCLDGVDGGGGGGVLVVAATNRPHVLDDALLRPGRFGVAICVLEPNRAERRRILRHYSAKLPLASGSLAL